MGILINTKLTSKNGLEIPSGSMVKPTIKGGSDILEHDEETGDYTGNYTRRLIYELRLYKSKVEFQHNPFEDIGEVKEFNYSYIKEMTDAEYAAFLANGSLAEQWIVVYLNSILGAGVCSLIDALQKD